MSWVCTRMQVSMNILKSLCAVGMHELELTMNLPLKSAVLKTASSQTHLSRVQLVLNPCQFLLFVPETDEADSDDNDENNETSHAANDKDGWVRVQCMSVVTSLIS